MPQKWNAEIVVSAIKERQAQGAALDLTSVNRINRILVWAATKYHSSWRKAVEAAGFDYTSITRINPDRRSWSKASIIEGIQELHKQDLPLNSNYVQTQQQLLYGAACKYFGGWPQAIAAAGFDYDQVRVRELRSWSKEAIVDAIVARVTAGKPINGPTVADEDRGLYSAAKRHFGRGGWAKARELAGFTPIDPDPRIIWTEASVRAEIQRFYENGMPLNVGALYGTEYAYLLAAGRKAFGTWAKAVEAAGLEYSKVRKNHQPWTKKEVIMGIKTLNKQGIRLSSKAIQNSHGGLFAAAVIRFGCWSQAVEAAGISYRKHSRTWSTKAWLRRMHPEEYQRLLHGAGRHAQTRRRATG